MQHDDIRHRMSEYLDGSVTAQDKAEIEDHLKTCPECENALNELRKAIEQIKSIEEIDPPAWITQKIMAKVRIVAEEKKSLFQRLFFPLSIKVPIQAVAVVFLTITAFYIYRDIQPTAKFAELPFPSRQKKEAKQEPPPAPVTNRQVNKSDDFLLRSKQVPQTPGYNALDMSQEYVAPAPPTLKSQLAVSAPAKPAELPPSEKKDVVSAGAATQVKVKRESVASMKNAKEPIAKAEADRRLERDIIETYANGNPKVVITYIIINSQKKKLAEERFTLDGERQGIQKEYYASGQLKIEAQYGYGKLVWYVEYGPDVVKKMGESDYDWFWLKK